MKDLAAFWPFRPSRADRDADLLLSTVTQIARQPQFFGAGRAPDTLQGRLEMMTLHASLAFFRLNAEEGAAPSRKHSPTSCFANSTPGCVKRRSGTSRCQRKCAASRAR